MGFTFTVPSSTSSNLLLNIFPSFTSIPSFKPLRKRCCSSVTIIHAAATQSENGAVAVTTSEKPNKDNYGRQYFPLAAVVGQRITVDAAAIDVTYACGDSKNCNLVASI